MSAAPVPAASVLACSPAPRRVAGLACDCRCSVPACPLSRAYDQAKRDYTGIWGTGGQEVEGGFNQF